MRTKRKMRVKKKGEYERAKKGNGTAVKKKENEAK